MQTDLSPSAIAGISIFSGIPEEGLAELLSLADQIEIGEGEVLFTEDMPADAFFVILSGRIDLYTHGDKSADQFIAHLETGAIIGETSLLIDRMHSASARASESTKLLRISDARFKEMLDAESLAAYRLVANLARVLAARLRAANDHVVEVAAKEATTPAAEDDLDRLRKIFFTDWGL